MARQNSPPIFEFSPSEQAKSAWHVFTPFFNSENYISIMSIS
ncbi:MAG: hypothetical protein ACTSRZ_08065 [Promethearchaeota archaeon]